MGAWDLPNRTVLLGEVAHQEVDGDHCRCQVHDAALLVERQRSRVRIRLDVDPQCLRLPQTIRRQLVGLHDVAVQVLVLDGARQTKIATRSSDAVAPRAEDRLQQRRGGGQVIASAQARSCNIWRVAEQVP